MKVCVVGAGPCGLTTIKQLLDEGHEVVCFDKNADLGGIWFRHEGDQTQAKAFDNLVLTISMKLMAYSDYPYQEGRIFRTREQYFAYLQEYARRFRLVERIQFGSEVTGLTKNARSWTVTVRRDGVEHTEEFGAVAICSGPFKTPNRTIPGLENFTGEIVHSAEYRNNQHFAGKRVLVVGLAESGADIVREIGDVAEACTLSIRSYTYLLPRVLGNRTTDQGTVRSHHHEMLRRATDKPLAYESFWGRNRVAKALFLGASVLYGVATTAQSFVSRRLPGRRAAAAEAPRPSINPMGEPIEPPKLDLGTEHNRENWDMVRTWNHRSHPDGSWAQQGIFCKNVSFIPSIVNGQVVVNDAGIDRSEGARSSSRTARPRSTT